MREKYLNTTAFVDKENLQAFLSELYVFLIDQMHAALNKVIPVLMLLYNGVNFQCYLLDARRALFLMVHSCKFNHFHKFVMDLLVVTSSASGV